jgi:hypothetical protein
MMTPADKLNGPTRPEETDLPTQDPNRFERGR